METAATRTAIQNGQFILEGITMASVAICKRQGWRASLILLAISLGALVGGCGGMNKLRMEEFDKHLQTVMYAAYNAAYCDPVIADLAPEASVTKITYTVTTEVGATLSIPVSPAGPAGPDVTPSVQRTHDMAIEITMNADSCSSSPESEKCNCQGQHSAKTDASRTDSGAKKTSCQAKQVEKRDQTCNKIKEGITRWKQSYEQEQSHHWWDRLLGRSSKDNQAPKPTASGGG